jgi:DNA modification methylase
VVFWNIGDSYCGAWGNYGHRPELDGTPSHQRQKNTIYLKRGGWDNRRDRPASSYKQEGLKPKDLCLIPFRVALAAQADGWWARSDIIWAKPNPMPESIRDRPTRSHEYILMLTKSARYYWNAAAVMEKAIGATSGGAGKRNLRSVWTFPARPYRGAHFAVFPLELPKRCIEAATRRGNLVLDPFAGTGTVGVAATKLNRRSVLLDLTYQRLARRRLVAQE